MLRQGQQTLATIAAAAATGTITCVAKASLVDGETITISDGTNAATVFEWDVNGTGVEGTNVQVDISAVTTAQECATALRAAINGVTTTLTVTAGAPTDGVMALTADTSDATHNVAITHTVASEDFAVTGMSGGITAGGAISGTAVAVSGLKDLDVWLHSADFVGTYVLYVSHDAGGSYVTCKTATVSSGATSTLVRLPPCDRFRVDLTTGTSGTMSVKWGGDESCMALQRP